MSKKVNNNNDINLAKSKIEKILVEWFLSDPVMLGVFCLVDKVPDTKQKTLGISTKSQPPCIKYNPNFINTISKERLECVLAQEGFKLLLKHPTTRLAKPKNISGLSSSITVTPYSLGPLMNMDGMEEFFPTAEKFNLPKDKFYEEYFRRLMNNQEEVNQQIKDIWDSMSDQEKQEMIDNAMNQQGQGSSEKQGQGSGENQEKDEKQDSDQQGQGSGQGNFEEFNNEDNAMKEYFDPNSTNTDEWEPNDLFDAEVKQKVDEKKNSIKDWGKFTGDAMGDIVAANTPKISWKEIVRRFSRSVLSRRTVSSRMKLNRRYGLRFPGARREYDTEIIFAVDVSGSMSDEDLAEGMSVMNSTCGHAKITYIQFDTEIKKVEKDFKKAKQKFSVLGRGGTDFQCIIDYANENNVDGVVIYTDGYAPEPTKLKRRAKMLWLLHAKDSKPPCDWGFSAHLDRFENTH